MQLGKFQKLMQCTLGIELTLLQQGTQVVKQEDWRVHTKAQGERATTQGVQSNWKTKEEFCRRKSVLAKKDMYVKKLKDNLCRLC